MPWNEYEAEKVEDLVGQLGCEEMGACVDCGISADHMQRLVVMAENAIILLRRVQELRPTEADLKLRDQIAAFLDGKPEEAGE
jgi:hypothetical protein